MTTSPVRITAEPVLGDPVTAGSTTVQRLRAVVVRRPVMALTLAAVVFVGVCLAFWPPAKEQYDLRVYVAAAQAVLDGRDIYTAHEGIYGLLGYTYPPFAAILMAPLGLLSTGGGRILMTVVNALVLLLIGSLTVRALRPRWSTRHVLVTGFILGAAGLALEPVRITFHYGQINLMLMAILMIDLLGHLPQRFRGVLIGVATGIKLTPGIFIIYLLVTRRYREALTASAATAGTMVLGFVVMPESAWKFWSSYIFDPTRPGSSTLVTNQALRGVIDRLSGGPQGIGPVWIAAVLITLIVGFVTVRRAYDRGLLLESILLAATIGVLVSPISWTAHWVWAFPATALLWNRVAASYRTTGRSRQFAVRAGLAAFVTLTFGIGLPWLAPHMRDRELHHHGFQLYLGNSYMICGVVMLLAAAYSLRRRSLKV
ncbi:glycosyltransferase 87 family protein [Kribbella sp. NPDC051587]|uniref:glycosyltransferase 87 family protein n=1 Tax=Kribbella sp. NPDC051587 TaxID=3364119 RepID=UPI0037B5AA98